MVFTMVRWHFLEVEHEYFFQILLEVDHEGENFIILKCTSKMSSFFYEYFIEIGIIELKFIKQISCEQIGELSLWIFFYFFQLIVQTIFAFAYNLLQLLDFSIDVLFKHPCDILFELFYFLCDKSRYLTQFRVNLEYGHIVFLVVFNLCFLPRACRMQTTQSFLYQIFCLVYSLVPVNIPFMCMFIFADNTQLFIMIAKMRSADSYYGFVMHATLSFVRWLLLLHLHF